MRAYIAGFFDADGSITAVRQHQGKNRTIQISFHNNELLILEKIREFIRNDLQCKGSLSTKSAKKETHSDSYELKYVFRKGLLVGNKMYPFILHSKKKHRIEIYNKIQNLTKRNGKYSIQEQKERDFLIEKFFSN